MKINLTNYSNNDSLLDELYYSIKRYETLKNEYYDGAIDEKIYDMQNIIFNNLINTEFISAIYNLNKMKQIISAFDKVVYDNY